MKSSNKASFAVDLVTEVTGVHRTIILKKRVKTEKGSDAKKLAIYAMINMGISVADISKVFGYKSDYSVYKHIKRFKELIKVDSKFKDLVEELENKMR